jgi:hypothetical protein
VPSSGSLVLNGGETLVVTIQGQFSSLAGAAAGQQKCNGGANYSATYTSPVSGTTNGSLDVCFTLAP